MTGIIKTKMSIEPAGPGEWLVTCEAHWPDSDEFFTFAVKHRHADVTVEELQRSAIARARDMLGSIVGIGDRTP